MASAEALQTRALSVLQLGQLENPGFFCRRRNDVEAAVTIDQQYPDGIDAEDLLAARR